MPLKLRAGLAGALLAAALLLAGCSAPQQPAAEPPTLAALQRTAYEAIAAADGTDGAQSKGENAEASGHVLSEEDVQEAILAAEEAFPGQLDSALYRRLARGADEALSDPGAKEAYLALYERGELDAAQIVRLGRRMLADGELRAARDLWELAARHTDGREAAALLEEVVVPIAQERSETAEMLRQAVRAAAAGDLPALIDRVQSAEWLNAVMPATGFGARRYRSTAQEGAEGELTARIDGALPIFDLCLALPDGQALSLRITPLTAAVLRCESLSDGGEGAAQAEQLSFESGAFLRIEGRLQEGLFTGETTFTVYDVPHEEGQSARWGDLPENPSGIYTGVFDEAGQPTVQQRGMAGDVTVGYDAAGLNYLTLTRPETLEEGQGVGAAWLPLPQTEEGDA